MATRTLKFREWLKLVAKHSTDDGFANLAGYPVDDVAKRLGVNRSRVYQLIEDETLDRIQVLTWTGKVAITLVTEASIDRYLAKRVPDRNRQGYFAFQE
jgi:predicted DNA-binding transcriptional regulator AlpA